MARIINPILNQICCVQDSVETNPPQVQLSLLPELIIYIRYTVNKLINPNEARRPVLFVKGTINKMLIIISRDGTSQAIIEL